MLCLVPLSRFSSVSLCFCASPEKFSVCEIQRGGLLPSWIISYGDRRWAGRCNRVREGTPWRKSQIAWRKGRGGDIRSYLRLQAIGKDSTPMSRSEQIEGSVGKRCKVILGHLLTVQVLQGKAKAQCSELFSVFESQSSRALLLWWRSLTKSISGDGCAVPAYLRARPNGALKFK